MTPAVDEEPYVANAYRCPCGAPHPRGTCPSLAPRAERPTLELHPLGEGDTRAILTGEDNP